MTAADQRKVLERLLPAAVQVFPLAKLDPLGRPMLLVRTADGREWWLHCFEVMPTSLMEDKE